MTEVEERPRFYEGQYLEAADLMASVDYARAARSRMLLGAHRWGIALGLDLREVPGPNSSLDVVLQPGYAWDGFGRPVVVPEPVKLSAGLFASYDGTAAPGVPVEVPVWLSYSEARGRPPRPGFESCEPGSAFSRVLERFVVEVGPRPGLSSRRDPVEVAGRTVDASQVLRAFDPSAPELADASVPHQTLPAEDDPAHWLIPVGVVTYHPGSPGSLVARDAATLTRHAHARQYCGVVAGSIEATGGVVRVHDRAQPYSTARTSELLCVEGEIRADGDVRLFGSRVDLVASHAEDPRVPVQVLRRDDPAGPNASLTLVIGDRSDGSNRLVVGPRTGVDAAGVDVHEPRLVVTDDGRVGIGTGEPLALLHLAEQGLQVGASGVPTDNFHIASDTGGARALRFYNGDVGAGTPLMSLTAAGRLGLGETSPTNQLHVAGALGLRQNALYLSGDARWSSVTFNAHHDAANTAWEFPDPATPAATIEMDAIGGFPRVEVFTTAAGDNRAWQSRLRVHGHTGDVAMGHNGGSVGIGTATPTARLDVRGDVVASGDIRLAGLAAVASATSVRVVWGAVRQDGTVAAGGGFAAVRQGPGRYAISFAAPFTGQPTLIVTRVHEQLTADAGAAVRPGQTAVLDLVLPERAIVATADAAGALTDGTFTFVAIGPR
ncbi:MAG: hypothetical protein JWN88_1620 [Frankiales bacterium]|jgi:hypothetical protein|nr:hypothetical protein [Frankiales bacterium]